MAEPDWIPPFIPQPPVPDKPLQRLRNAMTCGARNWPASIYRDAVTPILGARILMVTDAGLLQQILVSDAQNFEQAETTLNILRPVWRGGIAAVTGQAWRWQRRAAAPLFTPACAQEVVPAAQSAARRMIARIDPVADLTQQTADAMTQVVFDTFLTGANDPDAKAQFAQAGQDLTADMSRINIADVLQLPAVLRPLFGATGKAAAARLHAIVTRVIGQANSAIEGSLRARLMAATDPETGHAMTPDLVRDNIVGTLAAGRETTGLSLSWAIWALSHQPQVQDRLRREIAQAGLPPDLTPQCLTRMPYLRQVIYEAMRLFPAAPVLGRQVAADVALDGHQFKKGQLLLIPVYALHRHPDFWDRPAVFDPDRFHTDKFDARAARSRFMPFGAGPRICLGMAFAMAELETMLATILRGHRIEPVGAPDDVVLEMGATLRARDGLHVRLLADPV